jgi:hypothetical protein
MFQTEVIERRDRREFHQKFTTPTLMWINDIEASPSPRMGTRPLEDRTIVPVIQSMLEMRLSETMQMTAPVTNLSVLNIVTIAATLLEQGFQSFCTIVIIGTATAIPGVGRAIRTGISLLNLAETDGDIYNFMNEYEFI